MSRERSRAICWEKVCPASFPFSTRAYREMYLEPLHTAPVETGTYEKNGSGKKAKLNGTSGGRVARKRKGSPPTRLPLQQAEEPTRLFSGLMLAEDTNKRFHFLSAHQRSKRLSTAFDGPTLYGIDSDADGIFGKIGEGGVAVDTVEDMVRLYDGFDLGSPDFSASMTISGPAPIIMAMYIAAAKRRFGDGVCQNCAGRSRRIFSRKSRRRTKRFSRRSLTPIPGGHDGIHDAGDAALVSGFH